MNIKLRKLIKADASDLFEYGSNPENTKFLSWDTYKSIDDANYFINNIYDSKKVFAIEYENKMVGTIGIVKIIDQELEIGYVLNLKYARKGIMSNAMKLILKWIKENYPDYKIKAETIFNNIPSQNLLLKHGFIKISEFTNSDNVQLVLFELK